MAVTIKPMFARLAPLIDLQVLQVAVQNFTHDRPSSFPYNLLIAIIEAEDGHDDHYIDLERDRRFELQVGHFYLLPCHLPIHIKRSTRVTGITIRFNCSFFHGLDIFDDSGGIHDRLAPQRVRRIRDLVYGDDDPIRRSFALKSAVMECALDCWPTALRSVTPAMWKYERVLRFVREHCTAELGVGDLAEIHGVRQDVFSRSFRRDLGISPKQHLADNLTRMISVLLLTTDSSLQDIADQLAFSSPYYLSRFFKKQTGMPPSEYRSAFQ